MTTATVEAPANPKLDSLEILAVNELEAIFPALERFSNYMERIDAETDHGMAFVLSEGSKALIRFVTNTKGVLDQAKANGGEF